MWQAALLAGVMTAFAADDKPIECKFPGADAAEKPITIRLDPKPSLKDQPGLYRVIMEMNGQSQLRASARPITSTDDRDILVRAITRRQNMYTIGLRDDGKAALNIQKKQPDGLQTEKSTRLGSCTNYSAYLDRWLTS